MALGISLQLLGFVFILVGVLKAARDLGAFGRWASDAKFTALAYWKLAVKTWNRRVRGKVPGSAQPKTIELAGKVNAVGTVGYNVAWDDLKTDEKVDRLRTSLDGLRDLVDRNHDEYRARLDEVETGLGAFEAAVDEQFEGHDARDKTILGWELLGGVTSMAGTILAYIGLL